jgi:superfamily II DNA or RNA helicase
MSYYIFEIPSSTGKAIDIVAADPDAPDAPAYTHYAYTVGSVSKESDVKSRRGIPFDSLRDWNKLLSDFPQVNEKIDSKGEYYPGQSVIEEGATDPNFHVNTVMRLGALELLANISSGRISANDKDPFPHQLALQQYAKAHENQLQRLLIADEVGLGKTIEIGLILRDLLIARGGLSNFSCLYLTKGGLLEDVSSKLKSVMHGAIEEQSIVQVQDSFRQYGKSPISGVHIASLDAARLYVTKKKKELLSENLINPEIIIIDECHHCAAEDELDNEQTILSDKTKVTRAYQAAYKLITGTFWKNSAPPKLVVLMSATPFRSKKQFVNLLRLLTHQSIVDNAYSPEVTEKELIEKLSSPNSSVSVIWRRQDDPYVHSWSNSRLFPNFTVVRPHSEPSEIIPELANTNPEYLDIIRSIREIIQRIYRKNGQNFNGFAIRGLETRLTSSSIAGACWIFRWCVHHQSWKNKEIYGQDNSESTENLRKLIKEISRKLAEFDEKTKAKHAEVSFPSDDFHFAADSLSKAEKVDDIYRFRKKLNDRDDDNAFIADASEVLELTNLALKLLNFTSIENGTGVENAKLNWLKEMLEIHPKARFLVFTESLQTCEVITKSLPRQSEKITGDMGNSARELVVKKFRDLNGQERVLVATSAADEGMDFQVANHVVHWDLSPSPAVLMQRNGRVARLGQVSDVTAYYLIMAGTHEERRDQALREKFASLGITDERLRLKILGNLSSEELEEAIYQAVEDDGALIDDILSNAKKANDEMEQQLDTLQKKIEPKWTIDRSKLAERLECWHKLGLPESCNFKLKFNMVKWDKPIFGDTATVEKSEAKIASIDDGQNLKKVTFDPEFKLFGATAADKYSLAGLRPWTRKPRVYTGIWKHRPDDGVDVIGTLTCSLARQRYADFTAISASLLHSKFPLLREARYLLFATHPLREAEKCLAEAEENSSYLTFYVFTEELDTPLNPEGASAEDVYQLISLLEQDKERPIHLENKALVEKAKEPAKKIAEWLKNQRKLGGKLTQKDYFLPIPVALVMVLDDSAKAR